MTDPVIRPGEKIRLAPQLVFREEDDGYLLYDIEEDALYRGNESGRQILALCDGGRTVAEIVDALAVACGLPGETIAPKVEAFLDDLLGKGLAELS